MKRTEKGFTLIELLVVIAIIGILAAIAIPQFSAYRARGFDARARSDLRNAATAQDAHFATNEVYLPVAACTGEDGMADRSCGLSGFNISNGVTLTMTTDAGASGAMFEGTASHTDGLCTGGFQWNSEEGGDQGCAS